jgi:hypothetical protein
VAETVALGVTAREPFVIVATVELNENGAEVSWPRYTMTTVAPPYEVLVALVTVSDVSGVEPITA